MYQGKRIGVLIAAAGTGSRFGADTPKQFIMLKGRPMLRVTAEVFEHNEHTDDIYIVSSSEHIDQTLDLLSDLTKLRGICEGGVTRQQSVHMGLKYISVQNNVNAKLIVPDVLLIHDAARPFVSDEAIAGVLAGVVSTGAAVCCVPVKDTIYKTVRGERRMLWNVPPRDELFSVQTPQGFDFSLILGAHERAFIDGVSATDDGSLAKWYGADVMMTEGSYENIKVTTPEDLTKTSNIRVGIGFDVHAFSEGRRLILGGVEIPYERGLLGHSDADVLTHALMDAMLGALALGDIGSRFPDTDEKYKGISSMILLEKVTDMVNAKGYTVSNADMTIVAEKPRLSGVIPDITANIAKALGISARHIGIKATTTEGLGFTGREEGIGAQAIVALRRV